MEKNKNTSSSILYALKSLKNAGENQADKNPFGEKRRQRSASYCNLRFGDLQNAYSRHCYQTFFSKVTDHPTFEIKRVV